MTELFREALRLAGPARNQFVDEVRAREPELFAALEDLLRAEDEASRGLFESRRLGAAPRTVTPPGAVGAEVTRVSSPRGSAPGSGATDDSSAVPTAADRRYEIRGVLGQGGMGTVYLVFDRDLRREVAMKVVRGADDDLAEFLIEEAKVAGQLTHPNIVPVHDVGVLGGAGPYYTMAVVRGRTLANVIAALAAGDEGASREFGLARRVGILIDACRAISHAHARGVLHRDLKPANVMLGPHGEVLVMDWGLAKIFGGASVPGVAREGAAALDPVSSDSARQTVAGAMLGTPTYMAPEQAEGLPTDERTDVHALGGLLYELLTFTAPFQGGIAGIVEAVKHEVPEAPSRRAPRLKPPRALEQLCLRALAKRPEDRPASADEFLEGLTAWRDGEERRSERLGRLRAAFLASTVAFAVILVTIAAFVVRLEAARRREHAAQVEATQAATTSRRLVDFLVQLFKVSEPGSSRGRTITARELLDVGARRVAGELPDEPVVRASLEDVIGRVYFNLDLNESAVELLSQAHELRRASLGESHPDTMATALQLAMAINALGRREEAIGILERRIEIARRPEGDPGALVLALCDLAMLQGRIFRNDRAEELSREALEVARARIDADDPRATTALLELAGAVYRGGRNAEARDLFAQVLERRRRQLGEDHADTLSALHAVANATYVAGDAVEAERLYVDVHDRALRALGETHRITESSHEHVALAWTSQGRHAEAVDLRRKIMEDRTRVYGPEHERTVAALVELAQAQRVSGAYSAAHGTLDRVIAVRTATRGSDHPHTLAARDLLVELLREAGQSRKSLALGRDVLADRTRVLGADDAETALSMKRVAEALLALDRRTPAEDAEMLSMIEGSVKITKGQEYWHLNILGRVRLALDDPEGAVTALRAARDLAPPGAGQHEMLVRELAEAEAAAARKAAGK